MFSYPFSQNLLSQLNVSGLSPTRAAMTETMTGQLDFLSCFMGEFSMVNLKVTSAKADSEIRKIETAIKHMEAQIEEKTKEIERREASFSALPPAPEEFCVDLYQMWTELSAIRERLTEGSAQRDQIKDSIRAPLNSYLDSVNGQKGGRILSDADSLIVHVRWLDLLYEYVGITVKNRAGTRVWCRPAGFSARSDRARRTGPSPTTYFAIRRVRDGWRLVSAERDYCWVNQPALTAFYPTKAAAEDMARAAKKPPPLVTKPDPLSAVLNSR